MVLREGVPLALKRVRGDWRTLDEVPISSRLRLFCHEEFTSSRVAHVECIRAGTFASLFRWLPMIHNLLHGLRLLRKTPRDGILLVNGGHPCWLYVGLLNRLRVIGGRRTLCWDLFVETSSAWRRRILREATLGYLLSVVWSGKQVATHARFLSVPEDRFVFLPYKANHSKKPPLELLLGNYVFAGGNGKRDYQCLIDAVRGTDMLVVISATDPRVRRSIEPLPNVVVLSAWEPGFAQLQAGCRFGVIPMISTGIKGGGEANFCNLMWHGKPVIAADNVAAYEYIEDGKTGYVVPSGDSDALRRRMLELWSDEDKVREMGERGHQRVRRFFMHQQFVDRLLRLASLI